MFRKKSRSSLFLSLTLTTKRCAAATRWQRQRNSHCRKNSSCAVSLKNNSTTTTRRQQRERARVGKWKRGVGKARDEWGESGAERKTKYIQMYIQTYKCALFANMRTHVPVCIRIFKENRALRLCACVRACVQAVKNFKLQTLHFVISYWTCENANKKWGRRKKRERGNQCEKLLRAIKVDNLPHSAITVCALFYTGKLLSLSVKVWRRWLVSAATLLLAPRTFKKSQ